MNTATLRFRIEALRLVHARGGMTIGNLRHVARDARLSGRHDMAAAISLPLGERWRFVVAYIEGRWR